MAVLGKGLLHGRTIDAAQCARGCRRVSVRTRFVREAIKGRSESRWKLEPASKRSGGCLCYGRGTLRVVCLRGRAFQRSRLPEGRAVVVAESTARRFVVRTDTRRAGSAAHVRELPERLASIRLGCCVVLGNNGITLYAVR